MISAWKEIELDGESEVDATGALIQAIGDDGKVSIESEDGLVLLTDAVVRAWDKIDIEAETLANLTRSSIGILDGSTKGDIEADGDMVDVTDAEIVGPDKINLKNVVGTPSVIDDDGTLPLEEEDLLDLLAEDIADRRRD